MGGSNLMSAIAGRVLLIPKGNYDSTATYTMLDMVVYNGSSYICKQECTGVVPTNTTYWMLNASGSAVAYINDIGDVVITNPTNGQVLMYDSATQKWVNGTLTLNGLNDTQFASLSDGQVLKYNATSQKWENADEAGGILPHLIVISETGSTVTATKGQTVITATETSTGHFECDLPEFGTWTIDAILSGDDAQVSLVVDTVKVYTVDDSHFHATVTVKYPDGATCRLQSADETLYATGSPYTFTVHHAETYTITVTYNQRIYTDTVTFTTEGQSFSKTLPSPSEVDANDINWWLFFGGVSGTFSSLDEILANSTALSILMASTDAVDYLVRCKDWASNANDGLVPIMTSNTTPSGVCSASSSYSSDYLAWKAFDKNVNTNWGTSEAASTNAWLQYEFPQPVIVRKFYVLSPPNSSLPQVDNYKISASNNGTDFTDLGTFTYSTISATDGETHTLNNSTAYKYYRLTVLHSPTNASIRELQFYPSLSIPENQNAMNYIGLNNYCANTLLADADWLESICNSEYFENVLNVKVPTMTSNTTPSGNASASTTYTDWYAYRSFDKDNSTYWASNEVNTNSWIQYKFTSKQKIYKFSIVPRVYSGYSRIKNFEIQSSDDNFATHKTEYTGLVQSSGATFNGIITNPNNADSWRLHIIDTYNGACSVCEVQFYGREDV